MEPAMALPQGAKGKDPTGPSESSPHPPWDRLPWHRGQSTGWGSVPGTVPRQRQGGVSVSSVGQRKERSQAAHRAASAGHGAPGHHQQLLLPAAVHAARPVLPSARSLSPPCSPDGPLWPQALLHPHSSPLPRAQSCALTLLASLQLFHLQVMGELWKRNPAGLRRSIPPILCSPGLPLLPLGHWTQLWLQCYLCPALKGVWLSWSTSHRLSKNRQFWQLICY